MAEFRETVLKIVSLDAPVSDIRLESHIGFTVRLLKLLG
jgi:hypothetical protein